MKCPLQNFLCKMVLFRMKNKQGTTFSLKREEREEDDDSLHPLCVMPSVVNHNTCMNTIHLYKFSVHCTGS